MLQHFLTYYCITLCKVSTWPKTIGHYKANILEEGLYLSSPEYWSRFLKEKN